MSFFRTYTHPVLDEEIEAIGGHYVVQREERMEVGGREVVYQVGYAIVDSSCCGVGGCGYATVPGYIVKWKHKKDENGQEISEVEPVALPTEREEIKKRILKVEQVNQVNFW